jgi:hypothetical protein
LNHFPVKHKTEPVTPVTPEGSKPEPTETVKWFSYYSRIKLVYNNTNNTIQIREKIETPLLRIKCAMFHSILPYSINVRVCNDFTGI